MTSKSYPDIGLFHKLFICVQVVVLLMVSFQAMSQNPADLGASLIEMIENGEKSSSGGENLLGGDADPDKIPSIFADIRAGNGLTCSKSISQKFRPWPDLFLDIITPPPEPLS